MPTDGTADAAVQIAREGDAHAAILFDRRCFAQVDPHWREPSHWEQARSPVGQGGRGAVWFVRGAFGEGVLRHYRRGGLVGRIVRDRYLWSGEDATRCFREFRLLARLHDAGLPVPAPLVAGYVRDRLWYRADLLTRRIGGARTLAQRLHDDPPSFDEWQRVGATLARFHAQGAYHADLNAHNVLFDGAGRVWLLDFDRGQLRAPDAGWIGSNLARLERSLRKLGAAARADWTQSWQALRDAHARGMAQVRT